MSETLPTKKRRNPNGFNKAVKDADRRAKKIRQLEKIKTEEKRIALKGKKNVVERLSVSLDEVEFSNLVNKVALYSAKNMSCYSITQQSDIIKYNLNPFDVSKLLKYQEKIFADENKAFIRTTKLLQEKRIENLENEAWKNFEDSKKPFKKIVKKYQKLNKDSEEDIGSSAEIIETEEVVTAGDPRNFDTVLKCIQERNKMYGHYAPVEAKHPGSSDFQIQINYIAPDHKKDHEENKRLIEGVLIENTVSNASLNLGEDTMNAN